MKLSILTSYSCKNGKEMYKKVCCTCKIVVCLLNLWLLWSSRCRRRRLILRYLFFFLPGDVTRSGPILCVNECIHDGNLVPRFSQGRARCKFRALYDACSDANIPKRVLGTRVNPDVSYTCGRANLIWTRIRMDVKFLNPERNSCGFKNIRIRVDTYVDTCASDTVITQNMFHWFYIHNLQKQANKTKKQFHVILVYVSITISKFQQSPSSDLTTLHVEPTKQLELF